jgi:radical SAM protein with 4Fe4S-binding SPASM domain
MSDADVNDSLSWDNLIYIADFLQASGINHISLLGGEPLIHPNIAEFILYLHKRGFMITIFTSGIMPDSKFDDFCSKITSVSDLNLSFVCNVNEPRLSPKNELSKVERFFSVFGPRCSLSFNIYRIDFNMEFTIDYITRFGLNRHVRLGLAHPIPGQKNKYIEPELFTNVRDTLLQTFDKFFAYQIEPGFDCGFPLCMFSNEDLGKIYKCSGGRVSFQCGPAIDIGTDLSVWSCFPLSDFNKRSLYDFSTFSELIDFYEQKMEEVRKKVSGIYAKCDTCHFQKNKMCSGGCLAHVLNYFIQEGGLRDE